MSRTMLCNAALMVRHANFYSSFKPNFSRIFCSSFKLFENQTVRLSRVHCTPKMTEYCNKVPQQNCPWTSVSENVYQKSTNLLTTQDCNHPTDSAAFSCSQETPKPRLLTLFCTNSRAETQPRMQLAQYLSDRRMSSTKS
jgi:hypothetical protein